MSFRVIVLGALCCFALPTRVSLAAPEADPLRPPAAPVGQPARVDAPPIGPAPSTSADAPAPPDTNTTPKGALKMLAVALRDGDAERIKQVMHASTPAEAKMVNAMAEMAKSMATLQRSAVKAFGREGAKEVVGDTDSTDAESRARIDAADVKIAGDAATVTMADGVEAPVVLKRVDGRWRLPMSELSRGADPKALDERLAELATLAKVVRDLAEEVGAGKYQTAVQAQEAFQSRAMEASMRRTAAVPPRNGPALPQAQKQNAQERGQ